MGLAGMYFILLPASRVHMIAWLRLGFITGFRRFTKYFVVRGYAVLLFYIAFDVAATVFAGATALRIGPTWAASSAVRFSRSCYCSRGKSKWRGADIISVLLGRHAWKRLVCGEKCRREIAATRLLATASIFYSPVILLRIRGMQCIAGISVQLYSTIKLSQPIRHKGDQLESFARKPGRGQSAVKLRWRIAAQESPPGRKLRLSFRRIKSRAICSFRSFRSRCRKAWLGRSNWS